MTSNSPSNNPPKLRRCQECQAILPKEAFGLSRRISDGYYQICKLCRSEANSFRWTEKYGRRHRQHTYTHIRSVRRHNTKILQMALSSDKMELRAFDCHSKQELKAFYTKDGKLGMNEFSMFTRNGEIFRAWSWSGEKDAWLKLLGYLKLLNIRLELSDVDVITSKTLIYFL